MVGMENLGLLVTGIVVGLALGAIAVWAVLRARQGEDAANTGAELAQARSEAAQARSELAREVADAARARQEAAEARAAGADASAELSAAIAATSAAQAQRDAALARVEEVTALREQLVVQFKALSVEALEHQAKQADATAEQRQKQTDALLAPVRVTLEQFQSRLTEVEKERVAIAADLKAQVAEVKLTGDQLRRETTALVTALRKPQVRGSWGELQLKRVVEIAGMVDHCDFVQQQTSQTSAGTTIRPDLKVDLSEGKFVYVDSKVPLTAFLDAYEATDEAVRESHLQRFARNVRTHVDQLGKKDYFKAEGITPEFVILFLPSEALAAEAYSILPDLHEYAAQRNIVLATPTTLIAVLRAVAFSWRQAALADSAHEVFHLARELYDRLGNLGGHFDKVGRALTTAVKSYNDAVGSIEGRVFPTARKLRDLQVVADKELTAVKASEAAVRPLTAGELVEDAVSVTPIIGRRTPTVEELAAGEVTAPSLWDATGTA